ncbi:hypothetical protein BKA66DRAFT_422705 [Pyrenochaeta sp. MPI-SDFR-AT-0127]|nr:hypothetical protein BKA66DRAFT_422705 [Pyrenochaeta sp. MPI-SDFR-AT-0127]
MSLGGPTYANERENPLYIYISSDSQRVYTSGDRVEGIVRVEPSTRPVHVSIQFKGFSIIYDTSGNGTKPKFFEFTRELFKSTGAGENFDILRRGTATDGKVELPFDFTFPSAVSLAPPSERTWWYPEDSYNHPRFQHSPGFMLPPSCTPLTTANGPMQPKIVYYLEASMETIAPDSPYTRVRQELKFTPPPPDCHPELLQPNFNYGLKLPKHYKFIRTRKMLPGYGESSKLGKIRDVLVEKELFFGLNSFSEVPFARFNLFATPARILSIGSNIPMQISVQHLDRSKSLPTPPALHMRRIRVQLLSVFNTFFPNAANAKHAPKETIIIARDSIPLFDKKFDAGDERSLYDGLTLSDLGDVKLAHNRILPSFTSYGLSLEHELQVEIWGVCATHEFGGFACKEKVQVISNWSATPPHHSVEGLPETEPGPEYQELDPLAPMHEMDSASRTHELHAGGAVQALGPTTPAYELEPTPRLQQSHSRSVPPPPYAG